jgi:hypothetical protein
MKHGTVCLVMGRGSTESSDNEEIEVKTMDTFEQMMKEYKGMSQKDMNDSEEKFSGMCICPKCPTYTNCAKDAKERIFCLKGKSFACISFEKGCICPTCPVTAKCGMKYKNFCTKGAEKAQRYENTVWGTKIP